MCFTGTLTIFTMTSRKLGSVSPILQMRKLKLREVVISLRSHSCQPRGARIHKQYSVAAKVHTLNCLANPLLHEMGRVIPFCRGRCSRELSSCPRSPKEDLGCTPRASLLLPCHSGMIPRWELYQAAHRRSQAGWTPCGLMGKQLGHVQGKGAPELVPGQVISLSGPQSPQVSKKCQTLVWSGRPLKTPTTAGGCVLSRSP